jgi:hypothetical protein
MGFNSGLKGLKMFITNNNNNWYTIMRRVFIIPVKLLLTTVLIYLTSLSGMFDSDDTGTTTLAKSVTIYRLIRRTKSKVMGIARQTSPVETMMEQKQNEECGIFQIFGKHDNNCCKLYK